MTRIRRVIDSITTEAEDMLAVEEPLEIRLSYLENNIRVEKNISITMRTPGNDEELAAGFLFTEGIITGRKQFSSIRQGAINSVTVFLSDDVAFDHKKLERNFYTTSSCGVCGKSSIDAIQTVSKYTAKNGFAVDTDVLKTLPSLLQSAQKVFQQTGGLHASALISKDGKIVCLREDVGRHNALDKLIGYEMMNENIPLEDYLLLLSGRASFELMQKAYMAGIPFVAAIGAPSSLAVEFAADRNMTLVGFLKENRFNIYNGFQRIT